MFKIRRDQMALLEANKRQQNARMKVSELRQKFPLIFQFYSDAQLLDWVKRQYKWMKRYGIDTEYAENTMMDLFSMFGENFERCEDRSWAMPVLESKNLSADQKAAILLHESGLLKDDEGNV